MSHIPSAGPHFASANITYTTLPTDEEVTAKTMFDRSSSRHGRVGVNSLPRLLKKLAEYRQDLQGPMNVVGFGSSVQAGASLSSPYDDAPTGYLTQRIKDVLDVGELYNWQPYNAGVNGSAIADFATHWALLITQLQVTAIAMTGGGSGYQVGNILTCGGGTVSDGFSLPGLPATIEVLAIDGAGTITLSRIRRAGMYKVGLGPTASNSPTGGSGSGATFSLTTAAIVPHVVQFGYGMNDASPALFNSGQTYSGFLLYLQRAVNTVHQLGADLLMLTSPHPSVVNNAATVFAFPDSIPQSYPTSISAPVAASAIEPPYPNRADRGSSVTFDLQNGGVAVVVAHRFLRINQAMRQIAADYGAAIVDSEWYWFEALQAQATTLSSVALGEAELFDAGETVHPNLLGHQLSYHRAIDDFVFSLAQQSHQPNFEPRLNGYAAINGPGTSPASAVLDVYPPYPDSTTKPFSLKARTGAADGAGVKANAEQWYADPATGELVSPTLRLPADWDVFGYPSGTQLGIGEGRVTWKGNTYSGYSQRFTSYGIAAGATLDIPIADDAFFNGCAGKVRVHCIQPGVALSQVSEILFSSHNGTLTIATGLEIGSATEFTFAVSTTNIRITNTFANANYFIHIETW
jgi:lysophospholipase L1-like esterase